MGREGEILREDAPGRVVTRVTLDRAERIQGHALRVPLGQNEVTRR